MPKVLSRRELYDLIWSQPMTKIAADLGITGTALHKICEKHRIPMPGRGYWNKVAAGQKLSKAHFRKVEDAAINRVLIFGSPINTLPPEVREMRERAKAEAKAKKQEASQAPQENCGKPHPLVEKHRAPLKREKPYYEGLCHLRTKGLFDIKVNPSSLERLLRLLDKFVRAAEEKGVTFISEEGPLVINFDGEKLPLQIYEKLDRMVHHPTDVETEKLKKWEKETEIKRRLGQYISDWDKPKIPEWDSTPSGLYVFQIDPGCHWDGLRRKFSDGKQQRLENMIEDIVVAIVTCIAAEKEREAERERQRKEWEEEARIREKEKHRKTLELKRWEFLESRMKLYERAQRIEGFLAGYLSRHNQADMPESSRKMIQWAEKYSKTLYEQISPQDMAEVLNEYDLMNDEAEIDEDLEFDEAV